MNKQNFPLRSKKITITIIALFGLILGLAAFRYFRSIQSSATTYQSSMRLPSNMSVNVNDVAVVPITIDTGGANVYGVDVKITFDTTKLELTGVNPVSNSTTSLKYFIPSDSTGTFVTQEVLSKANTNGVIEFGAETIDYPTQKTLPPFTGTVNLANLIFKAKQVAGSTQITVVANNNSSTDSNIVIIDTIPLDTLISPTQISNLNLLINNITTFSIADIDQNGKVDIIDIGIIVDNYNSTNPTNPRADVNGDGIVNILDIGIVIDNYGH